LATAAFIASLDADQRLLPPFASKGTPEKWSRQYAAIPLTFEANRGQSDATVQFLAHGNGYSLFLTPAAAVLNLAGNGGSSVVRLNLRNANAATRLTGEDELPGKTNYMIGSDPAKWHTNVPMYSKVRYDSVYPGIDLLYYGNRRELEYDFVVSPGADPGRIRMALDAEEPASIDSNGDLVFTRGTTKNLRLHKPVAYQNVKGVRQDVASDYALLAGGELAFRLGSYDTREPLIIDPVVTYATYLGGNGDDRGYDVVSDVVGNTYLTGYTLSTNFPTQNPEQPALADGCCSDVFVSKLNASGTALVFSTYLGGASTDIGNAIRLDASGNVFVAGSTTSTDFPTSTAAQPNSGGFSDGFIAKLDPTGATLLYSTYLGGNDADAVNGLDVDSTGAAYVTGYTFSQNFPTLNALQATYGGGVADAFVAKYASAGNKVYATYLGGRASLDYSGEDRGTGIVVDTSGNAYITGFSKSSNFPTTTGAFQTAKAGTCCFGDAFVTKLSADGSQLVYSTYLGGADLDEGHGIALDTLNNAYVVGTTSSTDFPKMNPRQSTLLGASDLFVAKVNGAGSLLVFSTYLGGSGDDGWTGGQAGELSRIAVDASLNVYIMGMAASVDFPVANGIQTCTSSPSGFVTKFDPTASTLVFSSCVLTSTGMNIIPDNSGAILLTGGVGAGLQTVNPLQANFGGGSIDAFLMKLSEPLLKKKRGQIISQ
jgi:hypothetical protein